MKLNKRLERTIDPLQHYFITRHITEQPVSPYDFVKRNTHYLLITKVIDQIYLSDNTQISYVCEGMLFEPDMYRNIIIDMLLLSE